VDCATHYQNKQVGFCVSHILVYEEEIQ